MIGTCLKKKRVNKHTNIFQQRWCRMNKSERVNAYSYLNLANIIHCKKEPVLCESSAHWNEPHLYKECYVIYILTMISMN